MDVDEEPSQNSGTSMARDKGKRKEGSCNIEVGDVRNTSRRDSHLMDVHMDDSPEEVVPMAGQLPDLSIRGSHDVG